MFSCLVFDPIFFILFKSGFPLPGGFNQCLAWSFLKPPLYFVSTLVPLPRILLRISLIRNPSLGGNVWTLLGHSGYCPLFQHRDHLGTTPLPNRADSWFVQTTLGYLKIKHEPTKTLQHIRYLILCLILLLY